MRITIIQFIGVRYNAWRGRSRRRRYDVSAWAWASAAIENL